MKNRFLKIKENFSKWKTFFFIEIESSGKIGDERNERKLTGWRSEGRVESNQKFSKKSLGDDRAIEKQWLPSIGRH